MFVKNMKSCGAGAEHRGAKDAHLNQQIRQQHGGFSACGPFSSADADISARKIKKASRKNGRPPFSHILLLLAMQEGPKQRA